jgi:hypothetical protein
MRANWDEREDEEENEAQGCSERETLGYDTKSLRIKLRQRSDYWPRAR